MKIGFYPRLALDGIRKNRRMYIPYLLTCAGMVMMEYVILFLGCSGTVKHLSGGRTIAAMMELGGGVIALFACLFLFYTNSFLIRRRKKEFGLYNILGMGKRHIGLILLWETLLVAAVSLLTGLACGIAVSKLAELGLVNLMRGGVDYAVSVSWRSVGMTAAVFGVIFVLLLLNALRQLRFSSAIALLRSENTGEKPPRANWVAGGLGLLILAAAYVIAVSVQDPLAALLLFFVAVLMVIAGTYLLMIAGSVTLCRLLQHSRRYYYRPNHFVSVSSMAYRMKRNGAGLASICILATMVLVTLSSTASLFFGAEDSLHSRYPRQLNATTGLHSLDDLADGPMQTLRAAWTEQLDEAGVTPTAVDDYRCATAAGQLFGSQMKLIGQNWMYSNMDSNYYSVYFVPLSDYNISMGTHETLQPGEALLYLSRGSYNEPQISFGPDCVFSVAGKLDRFIGNGDIAMNVTPSMVVVVPDLMAAIQPLRSLKDDSGETLLEAMWYLGLDTDLTPEEQSELGMELSNLAANYEWYMISSREDNRADFYGTYGGLFYLGILLSVVFLFAAVLMIYYKQLSEGYEDQARFEIMQKVGMTKKEIRRSINSQLLTVFYLPLIGAGLHLSFAFPMIHKLLLLFNLNNVRLFAATTAISFAVFALFYALVYRITSNAYYHIVSGARAEA